MEATEHIVNSFCNYLLEWLTVPNIKCKGGKEIDLLAVDPRSGRRYHVETTGSTTGKFRFLTSKDVEQWPNDRPAQRKFIEYFDKEKFEHASILDRLKEYGFLKGNYKKVVVTWDISSNLISRLEDGQIKGRITEIPTYQYKGLMIWKIPDILDTFLDRPKLDNWYVSDDIYRTLQLVAMKLKHNQKRLGRPSGPNIKEFTEW